MELSLVVGCRTSCREKMHSVVISLGSLLTSVGLLCTLFGVNVFDLPHAIVVRFDTIKGNRQDVQGVLVAYDGPVQALKTNQGVARSLSGQQGNYSGDALGKSVGGNKGVLRSNPQRRESQDISKSPVPPGAVQTEAQKNLRPESLRDQFPVFEQAVEDASTKALCFACITTREAAIKNLKSNSAAYESWKSLF